MRCENNVVVPELNVEPPCRNLGKARSMQGEGMIATTIQQRSAKTDQIATFYVGELLLGLDIDGVQEINRLLEITPVAHAADCVCGVINLRGDVVTVLDLRTILQLPATEIGPNTRNVIIRSQDESIGLLVDQVADILAIPQDEISPPPANVSGVDGRFFSGRPHVGRRHCRHVRCQRSNDEFVIRLKHNPFFVKVDCRSHTPRTPAIHFSFQSRVTL